MGLSPLLVTIVGPSSSKGKEPVIDDFLLASLRVSSSLLLQLALTLQGLIKGPHRFRLGGAQFVRYGTVHKRYRPRKLSGDSDVSEAEKFIKSHEKIQRLLRLEDSKRPELEAFSFSRDAYT
ncbi:hypothetical protein Scep_019705 [Stephania cephalantha]|uniref:Uncharacterized protein n=1 Tax=Stephania cephalantha TaxID=152367 RepID=A0AAP0IC88_9MAGN